MTSRSSQIGLGIIVVAYLAIGTLYAINTPAWEVPDEPAQYNYIDHLAQTGTLPVLQAGDYDQAYLQQLTSQRFPPNLSVESFRYEAWQPPLYYVLALPVFWLFGGALIPLRLFSLALGAGIILFVYLAIRGIRTHPHMNVLALAGAGFVAFIPQHIAMMAGVNNDSLSELLVAIGLWLFLQELPMRRGGWRLGLVIGLAVITKAQAYVLVPMAVFMLFLAWRRGRLNDWHLWQARLTALFGPALILGGLWWGRNLRVYGWPDFFGAIRHSQVVIGQPRTSEWLSVYGLAGVAQRFVVTTFRSFWGQFGWMGVMMDWRIYLALLVFSLGLVLGGGWAAWRHRRDLIPNEIDAVKILMVSAFFTLALYLYYNVSFVQHQGRYLFPALMPIGLAAAVGLWQWARWISQTLRLRPSSLAWVENTLMALPLAAMAALDIYALYRFVLPTLVH